MAAGHKRHGLTGTRPAHEALADKIPLFRLVGDVPARPGMADPEWSFTTKGAG